MDRISFIVNRIFVGCKMDLMQWMDLLYLFWLPSLLNLENRSLYNKNHIIKNYAKILFNDFILESIFLIY